MIEWTSVIKPTGATGHWVCTLWVIQIIPGFFCSNWFGIIFYHLVNILISLLSSTNLWTRTLSVPLNIFLCSLTSLSEVTIILNYVYINFFFFFRNDISFCCSEFYKNSIILYTFVWDLPVSLSVLFLRFTEMVLWSSTFVSTVLRNGTHKSCFHASRSLFLGSLLFHYVKFYFEIPCFNITLL